VRLIAFLRAVNVGGNRLVKMDRLRTLFEDGGFSSVETFIASGNVVFDARGKPNASLEQSIETMLQDALGFEVATFVRTAAELCAVAEHQPFTAAAVKRSMALNVAFLRKMPDARSVKAVMGLKTAIDDFHVRGRELYWLSRARQGESKLSNVVFEKTLGQPATMRGISTIRKMADKFGDT
jgi:uncharacterized protein (DUF1697 family)